MAHIRAEALAMLRPLLSEFKKIPDQTETQPGIFYVKRLPMLHFHEADNGIVADLKCVVPRPGGFDCFEASNERAQRKLLGEVRLRCAQLRGKRAP